MIVGLDVGVISAALIGSAAGHAPARVAIQDIAIGLCASAIVAPAVVSLVELLMRSGASSDWALERAHGVRNVCRVLDVSDEDVAQGMQLVRTVIGPRVAVTAAAFLRHGVSTVVAFDHGFDAVPVLGRLPPGADVLAVTDG